LPQIKGISAVSFDGDGTLWDFDAVMRHSLEHVLREMERFDPQRASRITIDRMIEVRRLVARESKGRTTNLEEVRLEAFRQTLRDVGEPDEALALHLNDIYLRHRFEDIELFPDVLPTLTALQSDYVLGLLSNGNSYPQRCGLGDALQFVVLSQDHGVEKPDTALFKVAAEEAGCSPEEMVHVGDSLGTDVLGANNAGMVSIWLNRRGVQNGTGILPRYEVQSLTGILGILQER